jgi:peptidoglycan/xylan/chitin deacetylase (PgdA/CDA1 family)
MADFVMIDVRPSLARRIARHVPLPLLYPMVDSDLIIPYYHVVSDERLPHVDGLYNYRTPAEFRNDLEFLLKRYRPIGLGDLLHGVRNGSLPRRSFLLTFDDGFACMYDVVAPTLLRLGVPATFFLTWNCLDNRTMAASNEAALLAHTVEHATSEARRHIVGLLDGPEAIGVDLRIRLLRLRHKDRAIIRRIAMALEVDTSDYLAKQKPYLSLEAAAALARWGFSIGSHSMDHPEYSCLTAAEQLRQTRDSVLKIREKIDPECVSFAFPYSDTGVTLDFYRELAHSGVVALCFGTGGMRTDPLPFSFQRFSMEKEGLTAKEVLSQEYVRKLARKSTGRNLVQRSPRRS